MILLQDDVKIVGQFENTDPPVTAVPGAEAENKQASVDLLRQNSIS